MKQIKSIIMAGCLFMTGLTSCYFEEENIFDESAAQRINRALQEDFDLLTSSRGGWVMGYFPTTEHEGYTLLFYFDKNGSVRIAGKNAFTGNVYKDSVSLFRIVADNGPVLAFDTYNPILHVFSDPEDVESTKDVNEQGRGLEGDYEFIVMKPEQDNILLKGKKRGVYMNMKRLPEEQDWQAYFSGLDNLDKYLFSTKVPQILLSVNDSLFTLSGGTSHIFTAVPLGGDPITDSESIPFIVTENGICFSRSITLNNGTIRNFVLSDDKSELICIDKKEGTNETVNAKIFGPDLLPFYFESIDVRSYSWILATGEENMSPTVKTLYDRVVQSFKDKNRPLTQISYLYSARNSSDVISIAAQSTTGGMFFVDRETTEEGVNYTFKERYANNGKLFYDSFDGVPELIDVLSRSFKISVVSSPLSPTTIKFTDISDTNIWFVLSL